MYIIIESDSENDEEEEDEALDEDPTIEHLNIPHHGAVNRIRSMPQASGIIASMSDASTVNIYDVRDSTRSLMHKGPRVNPPNKPSYIFRGHKDEGYALDWSLVKTGRLATGDCAGNIHVWDFDASKDVAELQQAWTVDPVPYSGHKSR